MERLTPMTEFVLEQNKILNEAYKLCRDSHDFSIAESLYIHRTNNYAKFLKQPLTLGMFVPTDEAGNVLEDPNLIISTLDRGEIFNSDILKTWDDAKERVLFEGFEFIESGSYFYVLKEENLMRLDHRDFKSENIEFLIPKNIKLTPSAKKQINGN